ncbi:transposase [Glaesserella parasuis]|uniref:transposase n=1 Tax=Glaesserella parasuis TaxID=738 RepID=UPI003B67B019
MNYEPKKCHFCHSSDIRKHGIRNNIQRYFCNECHKTFILKTKLDPIKIWTDYASRKQTYKQLAENIIVQLEQFKDISKKPLKQY